MNDRLDRAQGCLLGQLIGDALGSLVEFQTPEQIQAVHPNGVRELVDGGTWNTIAGQPTDDSELALALARTLVRDHTFDQAAVRESYIRWYESRPFDIGNTVSAGLRGTPNFDSESNGGLMRISPLGILAAGADPDLAARWAREDAWITHPNEIAQDANVLHVLSIANAIDRGRGSHDAYRQAIEIASDHLLAEPLRDALSRAATEPPASYLRQQGWVLIAVQNAWYQLLHADSFEQALIDTVMRGGDTDTNAAICGALLGSIYGRSGIPQQWIDVVLRCRPAPENPRVHRPRPEEYWPVDTLELAERLLSLAPDA